MVGTCVYVSGALSHVHESLEYHLIVCRTQLLHLLLGMPAM